MKAFKKVSFAILSHVILFLGQKLPKYRPPTIRKWKVPSLNESKSPPARITTLLLSWSLSCARCSIVHFTFSGISLCPCINLIKFWPIFQVYFKWKGIFSGIKFLSIHHVQFGKIAVWTSFSNVQNYCRSYSTDFDKLYSEFVEPIIDWIHQSSDL